MLWVKPSLAWVKQTLIHKSYERLAFLSVLAARDESHPQDPDETLIDECCLLPSQLLVPNMDWLPLNDGVITKIQSKHPLRLQFGKPYTLPGLNPSAQVEVFRWYIMTLCQFLCALTLRMYRAFDSCHYLAHLCFFVFDLSEVQRLREWTIWDVYIWASLRQRTVKLAPGIQVFLWIFFDWLYYGQQIDV